MHIRTKLVAAAGALALVSLTPSGAEAAVGRRPYVVSASQNSYNVTCASNVMTGTAPIKLRISRNTGKVTQSEWGYTNGTTRYWMATWTGGTGSLKINGAANFYAASKGAKFPCPPSSAKPGSFVITVQSFDYRNRPNGAPGHYTVATRRVGSASGIIAPSAKTTVLGVQLNADDGPAPAGGVQTGAGGTQ